MKRMIKSSFGYYDNEWIDPDYTVESGYTGATLRGMCSIEGKSVAITTIDYIKIEDLEGLPGLVDEDEVEDFFMDHIKDDDVPERDGLYLFDSELEIGIRYSVDNRGRIDTENAEIDYKDIHVTAKFTRP